VRGDDTLKLTKEAVSWIPETERIYCLSITGGDLFTIMDAVRRRGNPGPEVFERLQAKVRNVHALAAISSRRKGRGEP